MLRFNENTFQALILHGRISIHPMLRFNAGAALNDTVQIPFQYILCYGSTFSISFSDKFSIIISIHPMLRFN